LFIHTNELQPLLNCASDLDSDSKTPADTARFILGIVRKARCNVVTDPQPTFSIAEDSNMRLLRAILHNLEIARAQADGHYEAIANQFGGISLPLDQAQLWRQFSMAEDTATARLCVEHRLCHDQRVPVLLARKRRNELDPFPLPETLMELMELLRG
jgi:hypothetical protein